MSYLVRLFWTVLMAVLMTNIPAVVWAEEMIPTSEFVDQATRAKEESKVENFLQQQNVRNELAKRGVSPNEITQRLASLSNAELHNLAQQIDQAQFGGDITGILVVVLLVVLIIFLVKRI